MRLAFGKAHSWVKILDSLSDWDSFWHRLRLQLYLLENTSVKQYRINQKQQNDQTLQRLKKDCLNFFGRTLNADFNQHPKCKSRSYYQDLKVSDNPLGKNEVKKKVDTRTIAKWFQCLSQKF